MVLCPFFLTCYEDEYLHMCLDLVSRLRILMVSEVVFVVFSTLLTHAL